MRNIIIFLGVALLVAVALIFFINPTEGDPLSEDIETATTTVEKEPTPVSIPTVPEAFECNGDAEICPDGSSVGRTGPTCEFAQCPSTDVSSDTVSTYLGGRVARFNLTINPREVVSDSRCPKDVQCIWAGTVEVRTAVESPTGHGEHVFKLGEPQTVGEFTVTLIEVTPATKADVAIPEHSYWFTYEIKKS